MARKDEVKKAIGGIVLGDQNQDKKADPGTDKKKAKPYHTITVGLTDEELTELEAVVNELGQTRHAVMKYAITDFVRRYKAGERPEYKTVKVLDTST